MCSLYLHFLFIKNKIDCLHWIAYSNIYTIFLNATHTQILNYYINRHWWSCVKMKVFFKKHFSKVKGKKKWQPCNWCTPCHVLIYKSQYYHSVYTSTPPDVCIWNLYIYITVRINETFKLTWQIWYKLMIKNYQIITIRK